MKNLLGSLCCFVLSTITALAQTTTGTAIIRHAPALNGTARVEGSVQMLQGESVTLNGGATITDDLLVPGSPTVQFNGNPIFGGTIVGPGSATPTGYTVRLNGNVTLGHLRTRINAVTLPSVPAPPSPTGTRTVMITASGQSPAPWNTLKNLTVNGNCGPITVPAGTYGDFTVNGGSSLRLGVAGATQPSTYNLQHLTMNGQTLVEILGPVILNVRYGFNINGQAGAGANPNWLAINVTGGDVNVNGGGTLYGFIAAPASRVTVNGNALLEGGLKSDGFTLNGGGILRLRAASSGNQAPTANAQTVATLEDTALPITLTGSDPEGASLSYAVATSPTKGVLSGTAPNLVYTPNANANGPDAFTFTVNDGQISSAVAVVTIGITPVNDGPLANDQNLQTDEDVPKAIVLTGSDVEGSTLTYTLLSVPPASQGTVTQASAGSPSVILTPAPNFFTASNAPVQFTFRVNDGAANSAPATVRIAVGAANDAPIAQGQPLTVLEDGSLNVTLVATDVDGDALAYTIVSGPSQGVLLPGADGSQWIYQPNQNANGPDSFTFRANDGHVNSNVAPVAITIVPVDDAPVANAQTVGTNEDTSVAIYLTASDVEGDTLTFSIATPPTKGVLVPGSDSSHWTYVPNANANGADSFTFRANDGALDSAAALVSVAIAPVNDAPVAQDGMTNTLEDTAVAIVLSGSDPVEHSPVTFAVVDGPAHGTLTGTAPNLTYTPAANFYGPDFFTFRVNDGDLDSAPATFLIAVGTQNDAPFADAQTVELDEDGSAPITLTGFDVENDVLAFAIVASPQHGTLTGTGAQVVYTPDHDFFGTDTFTFKADDGLADSEPAVVTLHVHPVNDAPLAVITAPAEGAVFNSADLVAMAASASDVDGTVTRVEFYANGELIGTDLNAPFTASWTGAAPGIYVLTARAYDNGTPVGVGDSATVSVRINAPPTVALTAPESGAAFAHGTPINLAADAADNDGSVLKVEYYDGDAKIGESTTAPFIAVWNDAPIGTHFLTAVAFDNDGATSTSTVVTINVTGSNLPPVVSAGVDVTGAMGASAQLVGSASDDGQPEGSVLSVTWSRVSGPGAVGFGSAHSVSTEVFAAVQGSYVLRLTATDGQFTSSDDMTFTLGAASNLPPVVDAGAEQVLDYPAFVELAGSATDDGFPAPSNLHYAWTQVSGPGMFFFDPQQPTTGAYLFEYGTYVFRLTVSDGQLAGNSTVTVRVPFPNQPPNPYITAPDWTQETLVRTVDVPGPMTAHANDDGRPVGGGVTFHWEDISGTGVTFSDPDAETIQVTFHQTGYYPILLTASDSQLTGNAVMYVSVVSAGNQAPKVNAGGDQTIGTALSAHLAGTVEDDHLPWWGALSHTWEMVSGPGIASFSYVGDLAPTVTFDTPGTYVLRLIASDGELMGSDDVSITVNATNRAPIVDAGQDQTASKGAGTVVAGTVTDDGLPTGQALSFSWSMVSGPGTATFGTPTAVRSTVKFSEVGTYELRLTANDSDLSGTDDVTIEVDCQPMDTPAGLVAMWRGEDDTRESFGYRNGTAISGLSYGPGLVGRSFLLNGGAGYMLLPAVPALPLPAEAPSMDVGGGAGFTLEMWIKPSNLESHRGLAEWGEFSQGVHFYASLNGNRRLYAGIPGPEGGYGFGTGRELELDVWQHVALTWDAGTHLAKIYLNGEVVAVTPPLGITPRTSGDLHIGRTGTPPSGGNYIFDGGMDEIALYSRALTDVELMSIYQTGSCGKRDPAPAGTPSIVVNAGADQSIQFLQSVNLLGTVRDTRTGSVPALGLTWSQVSGPGTVRFSSATTADTAAYFSAPGNYVLRFEAGDGTHSASDDVAVNVGTANFLRSYHFQSGNGPQPDLNDPLNRYTLDNGATWLSSNVTLGPYAYILGTKYIVGKFVEFNSSRVRVRFVLPPGYANPSLSIQFHADNALSIFLNDLVNPFFAQIRNPLPDNNFDNPVKLAGTDNPALFHEGENIIEFETYNTFGPMALDYKATLTFEAPGIGGNQPPAVTPGSSQIVVRPNTLNLTTTTTDDSLPFPDYTGIKWEKVSGPGTVSFSTQSASTTVSFSQPGEYLVRFTTDDGEFVISDTIAVSVLQPLSGPNQPPVVSAGPDLGVGKLFTVALHGSVADDGQPLTAPRAHWRMVSGPGQVAFQDTEVADAQVVFNTAGTYVLALTGFDGMATTEDTVSITVGESTFVNAAPMVQAGVDRTVQLPITELLLNGAVQDDGLPVDWPVTSHWEVASGPGSVELINANESSATARFAVAGDYVLRLVGSDAFLSASDEMIVHVLPAPGPDPTNTAPVVFAGDDQEASLFAPVALTGTVSDDGMPSGTLQVQWRKLVGPGAAFIADPSQAETSVVFNAPGYYVLRLTASDGQLLTFDDVAITVGGSGGNTPPVVDVGPDTTVGAGEPISVTPTVSDDGLPNGYVELVWSIVSGPGGASIEDGGDGAVVGHFDHIGVYTLRLEVTDTEFTVSDDIQITVTGGANLPPTVQVTAPADASSVPAREAVTISAAAIDPEGTPVRVDFYINGQFKSTDTTAPFTANWTPPIGGTYALTAVATDAIGQSTTSAPVTVTAINVPPTVTLAYPTSSHIYEPGPIPLGASVHSPAGVTTVEFYVDGNLVATVPGGPFSSSWIAPADGTYVVSARAIAVDGQIADSAPVTIQVHARSDEPLVAEILSPLDAGSITAPTAITGNVTSPDLRDWTLEYRHFGVQCDSWQPLGSGTAAVNGGTLGTLDPTLLLNGFYEIRLTAHDTFGGTLQDQISVIVYGDMKVGEFTFTTQDLNLQLPGFSLDITRTYHSTKTCADDFGPGWDLNINAVRLFKNKRLSDDWIYDIFIPPDFLQPPIYTLAEDGAHIIAVVFPNGETFRFRVILALASPGSTSFTDPYGDAIGQTFVPFTYGTRMKLVFQPLSGSEGVKLQPRSYRAVNPWTFESEELPGNSSFFMGDPSGGVISLAKTENSDQNAPLVEDASGFEMTMPDGRVYTFSEYGYLERMTDRNGNWVEVSYDGVVHSSGPLITFNRDWSGHITSVTDLRGSSVNYFYDDNNRLVQVQDRAGSITSYDYVSGGPNDGKLKSIFDPSGLQVLGNEYDANGRLFAQSNAYAGGLARMVHNLASRTEQFTNPLGKITTITYDSKGHITESKDPLGNVTKFAYDESGHRIATQDPLGNITRVAFEVHERNLVFPGEGPGGTDRIEHQSDPLVTKMTDAEGAIFKCHYDLQNRPTLFTDALGQTVELSYNAGGNVTAVTDPEGNTNTFTYTAAGQIASRTDALQHTTSYQYDAQGHVTQITDATGHVTSMTYDANGNELTRTATRTRSDGTLETLTTRRDYDADDRLTKVTDPLGRESLTIYDVNGRPCESIDPAGRSTKYFYDAAGKLVRTERPDGTSTSAEHHLAGRLLKSVDASNRETRMEYDDGGRQTKVIAVDGTQTTADYDAVGRRITTVDPLGRTATFGYDRVGRSTLVRDALGHETSYTYDQNGNLLTTTDAANHVTAFAYDHDNRRIRTLFADGTVAGVTFDPAGRRVTETDQAGRTKAFTYDSVDRLLAVTDAENHITAFSYDELGNRLTQVDALGRVTQYRYDALGRRTTRILPLGMSESVTYDVAGNVAARRDFNGRTTTFAYDVTNRVTLKTPDPALSEHDVRFTYTAAGLRATMADASGLTTYTYDLRDRLTTKVTPQGTLGYTYDLDGQLLSMASEQTDGIGVSYTYDELHRLASVNDRRLGVTNYGYDPVGNLAYFTTPNGVGHAYGYDQLNRLTAMEVTAFPIGGQPSTVANYGYTLSPTGRRNTAAESGAGILPASPGGTRAVSWQYDLVDRLTHEGISGPSGPTGLTSYGYDAVGNRLSRESTVPGMVSQSFTYDLNDRLTSDNYDANGNTIVGKVSQPTLSQVAVPHPPENAVVTDSYDFQDRLVARMGGGVNVTIVYNGDGRRVAETINGQTVTYLVDDLNPTGYAQVVEERVNGVPVRTYAYGHDLLAQDTREIGNQWHAQFFGYDGHGSVRFLTDEAGTVTDTYTYDAYGTLSAVTGTTPNRFRYSGEEFDPALGLYNLRARYLNAANGRFWNADSYEGNSDDPASLHRYLYCGNNPVNCVDPSGYMTLAEVMYKVAKIGIGATMGATIGALQGAAELALTNPNASEEDYERAARSGAKAGAVMGAAFAAVSLIPGSGPWVLGAGIFITAVTVGEAIYTKQYSVAGLRAVTGLALLFGSPKGFVEMWRCSQALTRSTFSTIIKYFAPGERTGFSGVLDTVSGEGVVRPSGETVTAGGEVPNGRVELRGGHTTLQNELVGLGGVNPRNVAAFTVVYRGAKTLEVRWNSGVNDRNFNSRALPEHLRARVLDFLRAAAGEGWTVESGSE